jgi:hypothetical protein
VPEVDVVVPEVDVVPEVVAVVPRAVAIAWICVDVREMDFIWLTLERAELILEADDPRTLLLASGPWHELQ